MAIQISEHGCLSKLSVQYDYASTLASFPSCPLNLSKIFFRITLRKITCYLLLTCFPRSNHRPSNMYISLFITQTLSFLSISTYTSPTQPTRPKSSAQATSSTAHTSPTPSCSRFFQARSQNPFVSKPPPHPLHLLTPVVGAYLICYAGPEGKLLREGQGEDAEQAVKALWTDVLIDAGRVMESKACGSRFGDGEMEIEDAGKWK
jgi:hypothetical protein